MQAGEIEKHEKVLNGANRNLRIPAAINLGILAYRCSEQERRDIARVLVNAAASEKDAAVLKDVINSLLAVRAEAIEYFLTQNLELSTREKGDLKKLASNDPNVRQTGLVSLGYSRPSEKTVLFIRMMLRDEKEEVRAEAKRALENIEERKAREEKKNKPDAGQRAMVRMAFSRPTDPSRAMRFTQHREKIHRQAIAAKRQGGQAQPTR